MATNRPKQRVLVRWNDDLDKSLLLFITHTCTEMGIKIPYDEIARRMGSTFTEGAIQQHISKLRNKMAELNVAPVPAAPKRGAVTVKPSTVYGQKGRAGTAPQRPIASKTQARALATQSNGNTTTGANTTAKRSSRRRQATIKRSESDEGPTDDEFGGASDDDFQDNTNRNGKRARGADPKGPASKKVTTSQAQNPSDTADMTNQLGDVNTRYGTAIGKNPSAISAMPTGLQSMFAANSVQAADPDATSGVGPASYHAQLAQTADYGEEEEEEDDDEMEEEPTQVAAWGQFAAAAHNPGPFNAVQGEQLSPRSVIAQGQVQTRRYPQNGGHEVATNNYSTNFQQALQPNAGSQGSGISSSNNLGMGNSYYPMQTQPTTPFLGNTMSSAMLPPYPAVTLPAWSNYNDMQQAVRNNSMVSTSSQNSFVSTPQTPTMDTPAATNDAFRSPYNDWARSDFNTLALAPDQVTNAWDGETGGDVELKFDEALLAQPPSLNNTGPFPAAWRNN